MSSRLYFGEVMHRRLFPVDYRFTYRVFSLLVDIDTVEQESRDSRLFNLNRFGLLSLHTKDHGARDGTPWHPWIRTQLAEAGIEEPAKVYLLCFPRVLGYTFNPLSVWYCENSQGEALAIVCEVSNTFGEHHHYVLHDGGHPLSWPVTSQADKRFHVSPFIDMHKHYHFRFTQPSDNLGISISEYQDDELMLVATQTGKASTMNDRHLVRAFFRLPLLPFKIITMIHWHALKIWLRGGKFHTKPDNPPEKTSQWPAKTSS